MPPPRSKQPPARIQIQHVEPLVDCGRYALKRMKVFRRLEAGINPELELLRFLTEKGFGNIAQLAGWYAYQGKPMDATLGILQRYVVGGLDGWDLALDMVAVHALVLAAGVWELLPRLEAAGASSILLVPVERMVA